MWNVDESGITDFSQDTWEIQNCVQQVTGFQEELTEMEKMLEAAIDHMNEALASREPDTEGILELHHKFNSLQLDLDNLVALNMELDYKQNCYEQRLTAVINDIQDLRMVKAERKEIAKALECKANVSEVNDKITKLKFGSSQGEFQKTICDTYEKFNSHEYTWQRYIDDLDRFCRDKCTKRLLESFEVDVREKYGALRNTVDFYLDILGEHHRFDEQRAVERDHNCLSCGTLPHETEEEKLVGDKARGTLKKEEIEEDEAEGGGDRRICYPHLPIPHPLHPRMKTCGIYCGGRYQRPELSIGDGMKVADTIKVSYLKRCVNSLEGPKHAQDVVDLPCHPCNWRLPQRPRREVKKIKPISEVQLVLPTESAITLEDVEEESLEAEPASVESLDRFLKYSKYWRFYGSRHADSNAASKHALASKHPLTSKHAVVSKHVVTNSKQGLESKQILTTYLHKQHENTSEFFVADSPHIRSTMKHEN